MTTDTTPRDVPSRIKTAAGVAILTVSCTGLVHKLLGMEWGIQHQIFYALMGAVACWGLDRRNPANTAEPEA